MCLATAISVMLLVDGFRLTVPGKPPEEIKTQRILDTLRPGHPRLILTNERLAALKRQARADERLRRYVRDVIRQADQYCDRGVEAPVHQDVRQIVEIGPVSCRAYALGLAWRWTGKQQYAQQLKMDLLAASAAETWSPTKEFLRAGQAAHGMGIGYDWLYGYLDADSRAAIVEAIMEKAIQPGLASHRRGTWWTKAPDNWNHVINGGLAIAALAVADNYPAEAEEVLNWIRQRVPRGIATFDRDGAWPEGPGYWDMATEATVCLLDALTTALGNDLGLPNAEGLSKTGTYLAYITGPTGKVFNYSDSQENHGQSAPAFICWLARRYDRPDLVSWVEDKMAGRPASPQHVLWYWKPPRPSPFRGKLDKLIKGGIDLAAFRSSWGDKDALFVCIKGGRNGGSHVNLDLGTFVMDALGVRWAMDLGNDSYSLPSYFTGWANNSPRWKYFRPSSHSHNVPTLDGMNQRKAGNAEIGRFKAGATPMAIVDLSSAYRKRADKVVRGLSLVGGRRAVLVQDEFKLKGTSDVAWGITTPAEIKPDGARATLTQQGRQLVAEVLSPPGASFSVESAEREPPEARNEGISRLMIRLPAQSADVRIAVLLSPVWPDGQPVAKPRIKPLERW